MGESKAISIRIPDELLAKVNKLAEEKYKSIAGKPNKSLVIQNALVAYFDTLSDSVSSEKIVTVHDTVSIVDFKQLQDFVATLSKDVEQLKEEKITLQDTVIKSDDTDHGQKVVKGLDHTQLSVLKIEEGLTTSELAERFGVKPNDVTSKKFKSKANPKLFVGWSRDRDPDGQAWEFRSESRMFYRVKNGVDV
jgi:metal-responsive CopG/Arc/MetJ family transcriptional regulator